jgi:hypothetical protein
MKSIVKQFEASKNINYLNYKYKEGLKQKKHYLLNIANCLQI